MVFVTLTMITDKQWLLLAGKAIILQKQLVSREQLLGFRERGSRFSFLSLSPFLPFILPLPLFVVVLCSGSGRYPFPSVFDAFFPYSSTLVPLISLIFQSQMILPLPSSMVKVPNSSHIRCPPPSTTSLDLSDVSLVQQRHIGILAAAFPDLLLFFLFFFGFSYIMHFFACQSGGCE